MLESSRIVMFYGGAVPTFPPLPFLKSLLVCVHINATLLLGEYYFHAILFKNKHACLQMSNGYHPSLFLTCSARFSRACGQDH